MRIPMVKGHDFRWSDTRQSGYKIILNQAAAELLFPGRDAVGQQIMRQAYLPGIKKTWFEVIGVVGNAKYYTLGKPASPVGYLFIAQSDNPMHSYSAVARVEGLAGPLAAAARSIATRLAPDIPAPVMTTMNSVLDDSISAERVMALLAVFFAGCALLVTAIGLYGTLAYATARRTSARSVFAWRWAHSANG
jgi:hypothetical protein